MKPRRPLDRRRAQLRGDCAPADGRLLISFKHQPHPADAIGAIKGLDRLASLTPGANKTDRPGLLNDVQGRGAIIDTRSRPRPISKRKGELAAA